MPLPRECQGQGRMEPVRVTVGCGVASRIRGSWMHYSYRKQSLCAEDVARRAQHRRQSQAIATKALPAHSINSHSVLRAWHPSEARELIDLRGLKEHSPGPESLEVAALSHLDSERQAANPRKRPWHHCEPLSALQQCSCEARVGAACSCYKQHTRSLSIPEVSALKSARV